MSNQRIVYQMKDGRFTADNGDGTPAVVTSSPFLGAIAFTAIDKEANCACASCCLLRATRAQLGVMTGLKANDGIEAVPPKSQLC